MIEHILNTGKKCLYLHRTNKDDSINLPNSPTSRSDMTVTSQNITRLTIRTVTKIFNSLTL